MNKIQFRIVFALFFLLTNTTEAQVWRSHLAYNNVTQIAMSADEVFAMSDGSLYSVEKLTEQIHVYDRQSGLHGSDISCIHFDTQGEQLVIGYLSGKIDILTSHGMRYISELYEKDMTQSKTISNITLHGRTAYLSTPYGVQTMDMDDHKLIDSYWLHPDGQEIHIQDVVIANDSIYAFTKDSMFCASLKANLSDYTYWKREKRSSRMQPDADKGRHYKDTTDDWYAGGTEGIIRQSPTERLSYKPQGPLNNNPYRMTSFQNQLWVVSGGRWDSQYSNPGVVMRYDGKRWISITQEAIKRKTGKPALDFMNVAVDPRDNSHYFVTSYGTGLYEFRADTLVRRYIAGEGDNTLVSASSSKPDTYTRLDCALFDSENNFWLLDAASESQLQCLDASGNWHAVSLLSNGGPFNIATPGGLIIDSRNPDYKWISTARWNTCVYLLDDKGTRWDASDDRYQLRTQWVNQDGRTFEPRKIFDMKQDSRGRIWMATDLGAAYIPEDVDFFTSDAIFQPAVSDENGENPITEWSASSVVEDKEGNIWIGTEKLGVYVLNNAATAILAHYTTDNSAMSANSILSMTCDDSGNLFIGTGSGLAQYLPHETPESTDRTVDEDGKRLGSVMQWKLHYSYQNPQEVVSTPTRIYALANGALFYIDRADDQIHYLSKASGLNGSTISQIAYDAGSNRLVIAYEDGRIDLLDENGYVLQMPDLHMKASSVSIAVNDILAGTHHTYLAMTFGILAINTHKGEISDTYYIGDQASDIDVLKVVELNDSLYAFTNGYMYAAALTDNLVDYHFWHKSALPGTKITHAVVYNNQVYILLNKILYRRSKGQWIKALNTSLKWIHASDNQLLVYADGKGLFRITDDFHWEGLTDRYAVNDAVYTLGEYWLAELDQGLIRLNTAGDQAFHPNGPNSNFGYFITSAHGRVYATVGGRWTTQFGRLGKVNIFDGKEWTGISAEQLMTPAGVWPYDPVSIAVDNSDPDHFYVSTYTAGVLEYDHGEITHYNDHLNGSTLRVAVDGYNVNVYTRTDGATMDSLGNLWVLNATTATGGYPVHVMTPDHKWHALSYRDNGQKLSLTTPKGILMDRTTGQRKWFFDQRYSTGLMLLDDGGTPISNTDDRFRKRSEFVDQQGKTVRPSIIYCIEQDHSNRLWVGTESGIFLILPETDFFNSNTCHRIIIPRNDGTGLGDYLLGDETINCMAVDGGNRMWIGTAGSGLYLIEDDTVTVAHFTANNSLLPSDAIQSITIVPTTGEVFVGTDKGIASYLSDASEAHQDMSQAYAFPNPVRPEYGGAISICGLMDNSEVNIIDSGGNLVCKTRSHGGTAVWDGHLPDGRRATAGVYTALCNANGGRTAVKILVIR